MRNQKNIILYKMLTKVTFILLAFILTLASCRKENNTSKLSSKSCFVLPSNLGVVGYVVCDGEPGFFASTTETINFGPGNDFGTQSKFSWIGLNKANGKFSQSLLDFYPPLPNFTTRSNGLTQLMPNRNSFILVSNYTHYDTGFNSTSHVKVYLTNKNLTSIKRFKLLDSTVSIDNVIQMPDGRFVVSSHKGITKSISCYNSNLQLDWTKIAEYGSNSQDYNTTELMATPNYIYVLQNSKYITRNYRVLQYDYDGRKISIYELTSITNKYAAGQIIESPNGFYIIGAKYLPEKSDYDLSVSTMSTTNKLIEEHGLNITDYFPDWNTASLNVFNTYFSNECSYTIKTTSGYAFTFTYPDNKNNRSLALVLLDDQMKVKSVKVIAKIKGVDINQINNQSIAILTDGNRLYILWNQYFNNYFYVLDEEGNLIK